MDNPTVDDVLRQYVKVLTDGIKLSRHKDAVDELESQFVEQRGAGLFVDVPPRVDLASRWAALMDYQFNTRQYSQWLETEFFGTGRFYGYYVILFPLLGADGYPAGFTVYRLTGERFGEGEKWFTPPRAIELDAEGHLIPDVRPIEETTENTRQWNARIKELARFKDAHHGRTPHQEAEYQKRRKQWRQKDYLKNKD